MAWYVRFQTPHVGPAKNWPLGIFRAVPYLRDSEQYDIVFGNWVEEVYEWFNDNLIVPPCSELDRRAVFWFRSDAREFVTTAWSLVAAYREAGIHASLRRTNCPGRIVYTDKHQIAAIPYWHFGRGPPECEKQQYVLGVCRIRTRPCEGRGPGSIPGEDT